MKQVVIVGVMPTRFGKMLIINPQTDKVYITNEQWNIIKDSGCTHVSYVTEAGYKDKNNVEHTYADGPRNNFAGVNIVTAADKYKAMAEAGLTLSI